MTEEPSVECRLTRDNAGVITSVEPSIVEVLGWRPEDLIGQASTGFIHPEDQGTAISAWFEMIAAAGSVKSWRGRYRTAQGGWQWVHTVNTNRLDDPDEPVVSTVIRRVTVEQVSVAEELRAREQLITRLSDALPVGVFQIDKRRCITFTNDRLQTILGTPAAATIDAQLAGLVDEDAGALQVALDTVLDNRAVDDLEVRFKNASSDASPHRVCLISLRPLTDDAGAVTGAIGCLTDVTDKAQLRRELEIRAAIDELTRCLNRSAILQMLEIMLDRLGSSSAGLAVLFVDLDRFKEVNDRFGHAAGDHVLVDVAGRIRRALRDDDRVGRIGGDEFLVVCPSVRSAAEAQQVALRVHAAVHHTASINGETIEVEASLGVAYTSCRASADVLVARADRAMYESKLAGRSHVTLAADDEGKRR